MHKKTKDRTPAVRPDAFDRKLVQTAYAPTTSEEREAAFQHLLAQLSEFYDAAFVTVSWMESGKTLSLTRGIGNNFAVRAMVMDAADELNMGPPDDDDDEIPA